MLLELALSVLAALPSVAPDDPAVWRERLFVPPLALDDFALVRFEPEDLELGERPTPVARLRALEARVKKKDADPRVRLELAKLFAAHGRVEDSYALFSELGAELGARIELEEGNWELAAIYGEVLATYGDTFRKLSTLEQGEAVLRRALEAEPALWRAADALCALHLAQALALRAAGDAVGAQRELDLALSFGARAVEVAPEEFRAHRTRFLARWAAVGAGGTLESALDAIGGLRASALHAPEPEWTAAMADALEASLLVGACAPADRPEEAFADLPEALRARPAAVEAGLVRLEAHPTLGEASRRLRWLLAFYGARADERERFEQALAESDRPELWLEARLGLLAREGRLEEARAFEQRLVSARPDARTQELLASLDLERGELDAAIAHYGRSLELAPEGVDARVGMAVALLKQGSEPAGPRSLLEPLVAAEDAPVAAVFALGTALALEGERERARELLARAAASAPLEQAARVRATLAELEAQSD